MHFEHGADRPRSLAFRIDSVSRQRTEHATVTGGYDEAGLSASGNVYTLVRRRGVWGPTKDVVRWVS